MQSAAAACLLWAAALASHSRADSEVVQPLRCWACGAGESACASAEHAVLCPRDQPYCATRASSPNFTSVLSCSAAVEGVCSLNYSVKGAYEMVCVCPVPLCNAPFSHYMQTELINYWTFNSANNSTQRNEIFWKLSNLANGSDANIYDKITEKRREDSEWLTTASTVTPGENQQRHVVSKGVWTEEADRQVEVTNHIMQKVENLRSQALRQVEAEIVLGEQTDEEPRAQAVRQLPPTVAPSDDDEDESEGSGGEEETTSRRAQPTAPAAAPGSYPPADQNSASPLILTLFLILSLLLHTIV